MEHIATILGQISICCILPIMVVWLIVRHCHESKQDGDDGVLVHVFRNETP